MRLILILFILTSIYGREVTLKKELLSENQDFIVTTNSPEGEDVGLVKVYPKFEAIGSAPEFELIEDQSGKFKISAEGLLSLNESLSGEAGEETVKVEISKEGFEATIIDVDIRIIDESKCIFVNGDVDFDGDGSRQSPRNVFPSIEDSSIVLFQRGSSCLIPSTIYIQGLEDILLGSYGTGELPKLATGNNVLFRIYNGSTNPIIRDLEFSSSEPSLSNPDPDYANWSDAFIYASSAIGKLRVVHCEIHHCHNAINDNSSGQPLEAENSEIMWNYVHDVAQEGIYIQSISGTGNVSANHIEKVNLLWFYDQTEAVSQGDGIQTYNVKRVKVNNNYIDKSFTGNKFNIIAQYNHSTVDNDRYVEIKDNYLIGNAGGINNSLSGAIIYADYAKGVIKGNTFIGTDNNRAISGANSTTDCSINYNIFFNCGDAITDNNSNIYNNLFYGCSRVLVSSLESFVNNIIFFTDDSQVAYNNTLPVKADYNLYNREQAGMFVTADNLESMQPDGEANSLVGDPGFVDVETKDFRIYDNSPVIGKGKNLDLTTDFQNIKISKSPNIGIHEEFMPLGSNISSIYAKDASMISINYSNQNGIAKVVINDFDNAKNYNLKVLSASGRVVKRHKIYRKSFNLSLSEINSGIYFLAVFENGKKYSKKIVILPSI